MNWTDIPLSAALILGVLGMMILVKKQKVQKAVLGKVGNKKFAKNWA